MMTKITCADSRCKFCKGYKCTAKEINLTSNSIMTLYEGRQEFNTCKTFEESEENKKMREEIDKLFNKQEMTFEDCLRELESLKIRKERLKSSLDEIHQLEKDLVLNILNPKMYKKLRGDK